MYLVATVSKAASINLRSSKYCLQEKELGKTLTFVNLQGELDKTYQVGFYFSPKPKRANMAAGWPKDAEENLERLKDAGLPMDRGIPKCTRCDGKSMPTVTQLC